MLLHDEPITKALTLSCAERHSCVHANARTRFGIQYRGASLATAADDELSYSAMHHGIGRRAIESVWTSLHLMTSGSRCAATDISVCWRGCSYGAGP
ncbi:hypothetical protein [Xanthomonas arboricola]|uniref:hypothetical protein n=1 Tax=Xanthomonas arboricola TaxID=56448 RepID=UPI00124A9D07|nr:hypothetical protein [Xanthomonas arboricola]MDN0296969.1 hypothetical protein [Xanthomonas arboricola pv. pruni]